MPPLHLGAAWAPVLASGRSWLEQLDRDILHHITCHWYSERATQVFHEFQSDKIGIPLMLVALALYGGFSARRAWRAFLTIGVAIGLAMLVATVLWALVERQRPPHAYEVHLDAPETRATCASQPDALALHGRVSKRRSFPSRHALTVGVVVTTFAFGSWVLGVLGGMYGLVLVIGRIYIARHWPSDMLAGLVIGALLAWVVWRWLPAVLRALGFDALGRYIAPHDVSRGPRANAAQTPRGSPPPRDGIQG